MQRRPFPTEEDLASLDEEALKARDEAEREDDDDEEWIGPIELRKNIFFYGAKKKLFDMEKLCYVMA